MSTTMLRLVVCMVAVFRVAAIAGDAGKNSKELFQFVKEARTLGLKEDEIRRSARSAGWTDSSINEVLASIPTQKDPEAALREATMKKAASIPGDYRIGAGDVLQIVVWKEPDASVPGVVVRSDGKITMPLIKELYVAGMTPLELEKVLTERLGKLVLGADVTVVPKEINSLKVYLVGGVRKEGPVAITRSMTVLQAITEAGGLTEYAKAKKIYVLRNQGGKQVRMPFDYHAVIKGEHEEQNIVLMPDDTVVVPR